LTDSTLASSLSPASVGSNSGSNLSSWESALLAVAQAER
jgi:hypothetical protein